MKGFRKLALVTSALTATLIAWGGLVRATGSGDGCPDWPKCFGRWIPPLEYHALIEYTHRALNVVVLLIGVMAVIAWRRHRDRPAVLRPALAAVPLVLFQAVLGGVVVKSGLDPWWITGHFATAMIVLAVVVLATVRAFTGERAHEEATDARFSRLAALTAAATFALLLVGTYVRAQSAGIVFRDWPLMDGRLVPTLGGAATLMFAHRVLAAAVALLVLWTAIRARALPSRPRAVVILSTLALTLFAGQILVGAANVWSRLRPAAVAGHVALSALIWATLVALAIVSRPTAAERRAEPVARGAAPGRSGRSFKETATAYFRLTKPRIIVLLLITTVPAMVLAQRGMPSLWLVLATLVGGSIAAGSANAINCYLDRDIDEMMKRTRRRPLPAHEVEPEQALAFGYVLGVLSFFFLGITVNVLAASLALSAIAFYVFVYTIWLKRTSTQNIVIGGAAGAIPALVGWAAVTGGVGLPAVILFAIIFVWTPAHFWALAIRYRVDYAAAGVPMLPVVRGEDETRRQILLYALATFGVSLLLAPAAHMGPVYVATAVALGGAFVWRALRLRREATAAQAFALFKFSIVYLALLFGAVALDRLPPFAR